MIINIDNNLISQDEIEKLKALLGIKNTDELNFKLVLKKIAEASFI